MVGDACPIPLSFNPLPHAEGDTHKRILNHFPTVSIHSLTQRETRKKQLPILKLPCFNPLPHAEGDESILLPRLVQLCFNPLPHAEGDREHLEPYHEP